MEEQEVLMIRFDHDLVILHRMTSSSSGNIYGYASHQAVNVWDFVVYAQKCRHCRKSLRIPDIGELAGREALCDPGQLYPDTGGLLLPWNAVDGGTV